MNQLNNSIIIIIKVCDWGVLCCHVLGLVVFVSWSFNEWRRGKEQGVLFFIFVCCHFVMIRYNMLLVLSGVLGLG